jgi:hypothetical protein
MALREGTVGKWQAGGMRQYKHIQKSSYQQKYKELLHKNQATSRVHHIHCIDDGGWAGTHSKYCNIDHAIVRASQM